MATWCKNRRLTLLVLCVGFAEALVTWPVARSRVSPLMAGAGSLPVYDGTDPWADLDLKPGASLSEIRKAYRKMAFKTHPDSNPDNPKAADDFKRISAAYELVKDNKKYAKWMRQRPVAPSTSSTRAPRSRRCSVLLSAPARASRPARRSSCRATSSSVPRVGSKGGRGPRSSARRPSAKRVGAVERPHAERADL